MTTYSPLTDVLAGGEWVQRGPIQVWVEHDTDTEEDEPPAYNPHDLIACRTCLARMDERCRRPAQPGRGDHKRRLVKRVCSCGGPIKRHEDMCGFCRADLVIEATRGDAA